ncbi:hypothetical protein DI270_029725 [Microbispora triticiradicis]|uniref:DUF4065 domain-containing protein n=2 Tax=Microbispora triticiradicis TaxID=2200763 RepID=A0ABX9LBP6_9ACTN|nr:hypothetical protein DI270_029725 [Microbispora triticiradicis]
MVVMAYGLPTLDVVTASVPLRGPAAAIAYLLASARTSGIRINRTKLTTLLYLSDLRAVEKGLPPGSGAEWRWHPRGLRSLRLAEVERDLCEAGVISAEDSIDPFASHRECVIHLMDAPQMVVDDEFAELVDDVLGAYGRWSATQLRDLTHQTPPMQEAGKQHRPGVRIDLAGGPPLPDLGSGLARLRRWVEDNPLPDDEPGGTDDLMQEIGHFTELRTEATRKLLEE